MFLERSEHDEATKVSVTIFGYRRYITTSNISYIYMCIIMYALITYSTVPVLQYSTYRVT